MTLDPSGFLSVDGARLEYRFTGPQPGEAPTLVLLHEGLGSAALWGGFPEKLAQATGLGVFAWSRAGYGASSPVSLPRPLDYMEREGRDVLRKVLDAIGLKRGLLIGHSDGASIAAIYAGSVQDHRIRGIALIAPHFFTEEVGLSAIARTRDDYASGDLRARLERWHGDVDNAFEGWCGAWLDPRFASWDISDVLATIRVPVAVIQGGADQYGTLRQVEIVREECPAPVEVTIIPGIGHSPHREATDTTVQILAGFADDILRRHEASAAR